MHVDVAVSAKVRFQPSRRGDPRTVEDVDAVPGRGEDYTTWWSADGDRVVVIHRFRVLGLAQWASLPLMYAAAWHAATLEARLLARHPMAYVNAFGTNGPFPADPPDEPGGVREPRRPRPGAGAAGAALQPDDLG